MGRPTFRGTRDLLLDHRTDGEAAHGSLRWPDSGPFNGALDRFDAELAGTEIRIRDTAMALPSHIGDGRFGGLLPATPSAKVTRTGDINYGLWYPVVIAPITSVVGPIVLPETVDRDILT